MSLQEYLPSKNFIKIAGSLLGVGLIVFGIIYLTSEKSPIKDLIKKDPVNGTYTDLVSIDTDGDGVLDWEENLWQTDTTKIDTDGDGVGDKDYIETKKSALNIKESTGDRVENLTETDKFARDFFSTFMSLYQSGKRSNQTTAQIVESASESINSLATTDRYIISAVKEIESTAQNKKIYATTASTIIYNASINMGEEFTYVDQIITTGSTEAATKLINRAKKYEQASIDLMNLSVPSDISSKHLVISNIYNNLAIATLAMSKITTDQVYAVSGMKTMIDNTKLLLDVFPVYKNYLMVNKQ
jgi:hypothetical protein